MNKANIRLDYNNMMSEYLSDGFGASELEAMTDLASEAFHNVEDNRGQGMLGWTELPYNQAEVVADVLDTAKNIRDNYEAFVVLGIGGSALGPIAVFNSMCHLKHNLLPAEKRGAPKFFVEDNVDPERMLALLDVVDVTKTVFNVITKSGATSETMSQYLIIYDLLKAKLGDKAKDHIIATTSMAKGNLIKLAKAEGFKTLYIPDEVGGRFSELCPVGLLPAAVLGVDIEAMLEGAADMDKRCGSSDIYANPALMLATLQFIAMNKGKNISVMMPYADSLKTLADWYCQLWAESLGKAEDNNGDIVNVGQTPVKAVGVTDQHSQVQLYTEGPLDKVFTIIAVDKFRNDIVIPEGLKEIPEVNFLCGHTMGELINKERMATEYALTKANRINHTITFPEVNEHTIGQFMYMYELATAYAGYMLGIDAFNQPGVEEGKNATYALFGRAGYEQKKAELDSAPKKSEQYMI